MEYKLALWNRMPIATDLKLTGEGDLDSAWTATVFPTWQPTAKLLCEYFFEFANFLRFGWHWVPDMKV